MASNCTYIPSKGKDLFRELKKQFGYKMATDIFLRAISPEFIDNYKGTLSLDAEGVPSYDSLMSNSYMKKFIGGRTIAKGLNKNYTAQEDSRENYLNLLESAYQFNTTSAQRDDFVAIVEYVDEDKINVVIQPKTQNAINRFKEQYSTQKLNDRLVEIFKPLGVTVGNLSKAEESAGRVGVTDFSTARKIATDFVSMIKVANNMEGATHLSEEFSHLLVGIFRNDPLMQRALNTLINNPEATKEVLGDDYQDVSDFYEGDEALIAEEALGHILQKNLSSDVDSVSTPAPSLFKRLLDWIVNKFSSYSAEDVQSAIDQVDSLMSTIGKDILNGTRQITKEDIAASQREAQFNALSDRIDRNIEILRNAAKTETKRYKITKAAKKRAVSEALVDNILQYTVEDADTVEGLFNYSKQAVEELRNLDAQFQMMDTMTPEQKFKFLRSVRMYVQSYGSFIKELNDAIIEDEGEPDNMFLRDFELNGEQVSIQEVLRELSDLSNRLGNRFVRVARSSFAEILKPFLGEEVTVKGQKMTVEDLLAEAPGDISFFDLYIDSMAESADPILQGIDMVIKKAKDNARLSSIDTLQNKVFKWVEKANSYNITDFDWMFERDAQGNKSGNYISPVNHAKFEEDLKKFEEELETKYGKNPSEEAAIAKIEERKQWLKTHAISTFGFPVPNPTVYRNAAYDRLTSRQKELLEEYLDIKDEQDAKYSPARTSRLKAIQVRKGFTERLIQSATSPSAIVDNIKNGFKNSLFDSEDDDQVFGVAKGLTDFAGNEFMVLPELYTTRLKNPNEISTDVVGALMTYVYATNEFEEIEKIIDPLEVGRALITEDRKTRATRGGKQLVESFGALGVTVANKIFLSKTNIEQKLQSCYESQLYHRYLKDQGTFDVFGKKVNTNKFVSLILKGSSMAQLGFNWLANTANIANGIAMQNIEAAAGQFFTPKTLLSADKEYASCLPGLTSDLGAMIKTNKLDLFYDLLDIKQDFAKRTHNPKFSKLIKRIFGESIAFLGQEAGDHWLYGRTAIAMSLEQKVKVNGKETSLWEALKVMSVQGTKNIKKLNKEEITNIDGTAFDFGAFGRKIARVNHRLFGIYNDDDSNVANRLAMGRLLMQYRKWVKPFINTRFQAKQQDSILGVEVEGYYRTFGRIVNELIRGQRQLPMLWDSLTQDEKYNIKRMCTEVFQLLVVYGLANWVDWPDDKDRPWAMKFAEYTSQRLSHELGTLVPSPYMVQEALKTAKSPMPSLSWINGLAVLTMSVADPEDWVDETKSGPYKGLSTLEKNLIKSGLPIVSQYRQIDKFVRDLDTSINYYARPAY